TANCLEHDAEHLIMLCSLEVQQLFEPVRGEHGLGLPRIAHTLKFSVLIRRTPFCTSSLIAPIKSATARPLKMAAGSMPLILSDLGASPPPPAAGAGAAGAADTAGAPAPEPSLFVLLIDAICAAPDAAMSAAMANDQGGFMLDSARVTPTAVLMI